MLAHFTLAEIEFGMLSALPVNQDAKYRRFDIDNDLFNNCADDPLLEVEGRGFVVPQRGQVRGELMQIADFLRERVEGDGSSWDSCCSSVEACSSASFQRRSRVLATRRFSGSAASY